LAVHHHLLSQFYQCKWSLVYIRFNFWDITKSESYLFGPDSFISHLILPDVEDPPDSAVVKAFKHFFVFFAERFHDSQPHRAAFIAKAL
jgi:hypothetical protein